jgi:hypothetical protein
MRKLITLAFWFVLVALLAASSRFSVEQPASAGQGKGGQVVSKPTPTPKKTTTRRNPPARTTNNSKTNQPAKTRSEAASAAEMIFWNSIKDRTNPEDFKAYLKKYPNGEFVSLAKNKLNNLDRPSPSNPNAASSTSSSNPGSSKAAMPSNPPLPLHSFDFATVTLDSSGKLKSRETKSANAYTEDLGAG